MRTFFDKTFWWIFGMLFAGGAIDFVLFMSSWFQRVQDAEKFAADSASAPAMIEFVFFVLFGPGVSLYFFLCDYWQFCPAFLSSPLGLRVSIFFLMIASLFCWAVFLRVLFLVCMRIISVFRITIIPTLKK